jgi:hypothetical protein
MNSTLHFYRNQWGQDDLQISFFSGIIRGIFHPQTLEIELGKPPRGDRLISLWNLQGGTHHSPTI